MNQPALGKKILELRQKLGLTQKELAESCNLSLRTIQRIESAEVTPRSHTVKVILSALGYDINNLSIDFSNDSSHKEHHPKVWLRQFLKNVAELVNLKTNTMKKIAVLSFIVILMILGLSLSKNNLKAQKIEGWFLAGNQPKSYTIGLDKSNFKTGSSSAFLKSKDKKIEGFGTLMQTCSADQYLGKKIKMTSYIKSDDVTDWAGMWLRVDSRETNKLLSFDNMQNRPIKGNTDWSKYEIILDVPMESGTLNFGVLMFGTGKVWFDHITFEVVGDALKTEKENFINESPTNLDFGK